MKTFLVVSFLMVGLSIEGFSQQPKPSLHPRLFIISIGIDKMENSIIFPLKFAEKDAKDLALKFKADFKKWTPPCDSFSYQKKWRFQNCITDSVINYTFLGSKATKQNIKASFEEVAKLSLPSDYFIFIYSGMGDLADEAGVGFSIYNTTFNEKTKEFKNVLSVHELKEWLEFLPINNQIILTSTCNKNDWVNKFEKSLTHDTEFRKWGFRNRIIIAPIGIELESQEWNGGALSYSLSKLALNPFDIFLSKIQLNKFNSELNRIYEDINYTSGASIDIFSEKLFFSKVNSILDLECVPNRGVQSGENKRFDTKKNQQFALVIGINKYESNSGWSDLKNPILDARSVAQELKENYGFTVTLLENPTRRQVIDSLINYSEIADTASRFLLYWAGHGGYDQYKPSGFLVCNDSKNNKNDILKDSYIGHSDLTSFLRQIPSKQQLIVLDACFGGLFKDNASEGISKNRDENLGEIYKAVDKQLFISRKLRFKSKLYFTSGGKESVPDGLPGFHSPFAYYFVKALRTYGGEDKILTFDEIRNQLLQVKNPEPKAGEWENNEPGSDFIFIAK